MALQARLLWALNSEHVIVRDTVLVTMSSQPSLPYAKPGTYATGTGRRLSPTRPRV